ncbi:hypothetical protein BVX98_04325 [bacterium F11]|nr:hypothetical protein BVX98_04325 [bacterium F11]
MKIGQFDTDKGIFVVAEVGNNHEGDFSKAVEMVKRAAECGVDAVKFQTFKTEQFVGLCDEKRFQQLKRFELAYDEFEKLSEIAKGEGIHFISTPLDMESAHFLNGIVSAFKIASSDNNFTPLIDYVLKTKRPTIVSTGLIGIQECRKLMARIKKVWSKNEINRKLALLHCVSSYPVPDLQANIKAVSHMIQAFDCTIGYSDHTLGFEGSLASVALGARIIEKHFTLDKNQSEFRDHKLSADPGELKHLVESIRKISRMMGSGMKEVQVCEKPLLNIVRRGLAAKRDLMPGEKIGKEDLMWIRMQGKSSYTKVSDIIGQKVRESIKKGELIPFKKGGRA